MTSNFEKLIFLKTTRENCILFSQNRKSTMSAATSPNKIAKFKVRVSLFLLGYESSGYASKLIETDLVNKTLVRESALVL